MKNKIKQNFVVCILLTLMLALWNMESNAQSTQATNVFNSNNYLGWTSNNDLPFRIGTGSPPTLLMLLHNTSGNLNLVQGTSAYQIDSLTVLWHGGNTTDIFVGYFAGNGIMTGHYNTLVGNGAGTSHSSGNRNTIMGNAAGNKMTTGTRNVFVGDSADYWNISSNYITCVGSLAGFRNTAYYGTFIGFEAGRENTSGTYNCYVGYSAGVFNTTGTQNTFVGANAGTGSATSIFNYNSGLGVNSLNNLTTGSRNSALGYGSGYNVSSGDSNTCVGYRAGGNIQTGDRNTFLGYEADATSSSLVNASAIGNGASVCASDEMVFGNTSVTRWGFGVCPASGHAIEVGSTTSNGNGAYLTNMGVWTDISDREKKEDFQKQDVNEILRKVRQLEVTKWKFKGSENEYHYGPMAQDFYKFFKVGDGKSISAMDKTGVLFLAVQALDENNSQLKAKLQAQDSTNQALQNQLNKLQDMINGCCGHPDNNSGQTDINIALSSGSIVLNQNQPNPFKEQTTITYFIPDDSKNVKIIFTDSKGTVLKEVALTETGKGQLNVYAQDLSSGIYTYTLVADGITIDSKQMVCTK